MQRLIGKQGLIDTQLGRRILRPSGQEKTRTTEDDTRARESKVEVDGHSKLID